LAGMKISVKQAAFMAIITGLLTFILLGVMIVRSGSIVPPATFPNEPGFKQAIFWFEMAGSGDEIASVLGDPATDTGRRIRAAMDATHHIDFYFMVCYTTFTASLFLMLFCLTGTGGMPRAVLGIGFALCCVVLIGDIFETRKLLEFSSLPDPRTIGDDILSLQIWTRVKSGGLSAAGIILALYYSRYFQWRRIGMIIPVLFAVSSVLAFVAISTNSLRYLIEYAGSAGMVGWLAALIHAGFIFFAQRGEFGGNNT